MILYDKYSNFLGMSPKMLSFLGFEDLDEFKAIYKDVADLFVEKKGYIYKFKNFSWIEYTLHSGTPNKNVLITLKNSQVIESELKITEIYLSTPINNSDKFYIVEFVSGFFNNKEDELPSFSAVSTEQNEAADLLKISKEKYSQENAQTREIEEPEFAINFDSKENLENRHEKESSETLKAQESETLDIEEKKEENEEELFIPFEESETAEENPDIEIKIKDDEEDFFSKLKDSEPENEKREELPESEEEKLAIFEDIFKEEKEEDKETEEEKSVIFEDIFKEEEKEKKIEDEKDEPFLELFENIEEKRESDFEPFEEKEPDFSLFEELKDDKEEEKFDLPFSVKEMEEEDEIKEEDFFLSQTVEKNSDLAEREESPQEEKKIENIFEHLHLNKEENVSVKKIKKEPVFKFLKKSEDEKEEISKNIGKRFKLKKELKNKKDKNFSVSVRESFEKLGISEDEERELIKDFINDIKKNILLIQKYLSNKDYSKIDDILNIIKSAASILNIKEIVNKIETMHTLLKEDEIEKFVDLTSEIEKFVKNMEDSLFRNKDE